MDRYQGLGNFIRQSIKDASAEGEVYDRQTECAVRMVMAVCPDMAWSDVFNMVKVWRAENRNFE